MWLWWLAAKMTGPSMASRCSAPSTFDPGEQSRQRQKPRHVAQAAHRARPPRPVPRREVHRLGRGRLVGRLAGRLGAHQLLERGDVGGFGEGGLVNRPAESLLERDHQLDAFQRAEAQLVERRAAGHGASAGELRQQRLDARSVRGRDGGGAARGHPVAHLLPLELPCALGPRQFTRSATTRCRESSGDRAARGWPAGPVTAGPRRAR